MSFFKTSLIILTLMGVSTPTNYRNNKCGLLYLTITATGMRLQVNWRFTCENPPDKIVLYESREKTRMLEELQSFRVPAGVNVGFKTSDVLFEYSDYFPCHWYPNTTEIPCDTNCYPYFLKSYRRDQTVDFSCLRINPKWMQNLGKMRIGEMVIPGAYMAGATSVKSVIHKKEHYCYQRYQFWSNLVFGIRYFDLSVGVKDDDFLTFNNNVPCDSLLENLKTLAIFLKKSESEVVILDFRNFFNFRNGDHKKLIDLMIETFKENIAPPYIAQHKFGPKLEEMWLIQKRIIINYRHKEARKVYDFLWNDIKFEEAKVGTKKDFRKFVCGLISGHRRTKMKSVVMAVQPTLQQIKQHDLRERSDRVNPFINRWLHFCNVTETLNLVSTAYINGNNFIGMALDENKKRLCNEYNENCNFQ